MSRSRTAQFTVAWGLGIATCVLAVVLITNVPEGSVIEMSWSFHGADRNVLFDTLSWRLERSRLGMFALLPVLFLTALVIAKNSDIKQPTRIPSLIAILTGLTLLTIADDISSLLSGMTIVILGGLRLSAFDEIKHDQPVNSEGVAAYAQVFSLLLLVFGLGALVASGSIVRAAPYGLPGDSTSSLSGLAHVISYASEQHPAAGLLWQQIQMVPYSMILLSCFVMAGRFFRATSGCLWQRKTCSMKSLLWLIVWSRCGIMLFSRLLQVESPDGSQEIMVWLWPILLVGTLYSAANFSRQSDYRGWLLWRFSLAINCFCWRMSWF